MRDSTRSLRSLVFSGVMVLLLGCAGKTSSAPTTPVAAPPVPAETTDTARQDSSTGQGEFDPTKWAPPETGPSAFAARVLATLPDPSLVALPSQLEAPTVLPSAASAGRAATTGADCREVQILASSDASAAKEESRRASRALATTSRLVESRGLYRVRLGGCLSESAARDLRRRAIASGYDGAFLVTTAK